PSASGWDCSATTVGAATVSCTYPAAVLSPIAPGTALPVITIPVHIAPATAGAVTNTATATSGDSATGPVRASDTATVSDTPAPTPTPTPTPSPATVLLPRAGAPTGPTGLPAAAFLVLLFAGGAVALGVRSRLS
ncbi:MAG: hypothetical protein M3010_05665, partial [Candidatus Dormibacteraeota bacterium]|nr:hypothetical protein [Candidatus Dormibacteraeota bacterium]